MQKFWQLAIISNRADLSGFSIFVSSCKMHVPSRVVLIVVVAVVVVVVA